MEVLLILVLLFFGLLVVVAIALVAYFIMTQRKLVSLDEFCKNAMGQIAVQLNSRWDAITGLVKMAAKYSQHESETLTNTINARRISNVQTAGQINEQHPHSQHSMPYSLRNLSVCPCSTASARFLGISCSGQASTQRAQLMHAVGSIAETASSVRHVRADAVLVVGTSVSHTAKPIIGPPEMIF